MELLLEKGAAVDRVAEAGETPLFRAASNGHREVMMLLLRKGAAVNQARQDGMTPFRRATINEHRDVVALLREKGAIDDHVASDRVRPLSDKRPNMLSSIEGGGSLFGERKLHIYQPVLGPIFSKTFHIPSLDQLQPSPMPLILEKALRNGRSLEKEDVRQRRWGIKPGDLDESPCHACGALIDTGEWKDYRYYHLEMSGHLSGFLRLCESCGRGLLQSMGQNECKGKVGWQFKGISIEMRELQP